MVSNNTIIIKTGDLQCTSRCFPYELEGEDILGKRVKIVYSRSYIKLILDGEEYLSIKTKKKTYFEEVKDMLARHVIFIGYERDINNLR